MKLISWQKILAMSKFFLYVGCLQALFATITIADTGNAQVLEQTYISYNWQNLKLEEAFSDIQNQTDFFFTFDRTQVKGISVSGAQEHTALADLLKYISSKTGLMFRITKDLILVKYDDDSAAAATTMLDKKIAIRVSDDEITQLIDTKSTKVIYEIGLAEINEDQIVRGTVTSTDGEPLIGAAVVVKETGQGTVTDNSGNFTIAVPDEGGATLVVSYIGYQTAEVNVSGQNEMNIQLAVASAELDEVVVVGYGTQRRRDVTGSIVKIDGQSINAVPVTNFEQGLQGRVAGVQVTQNTAAPGGSVSIRIRGGNSIAAGSEPLYVVDGVPIYNDNLAVSPGEPRTNRNRLGAPQNAMTFLNPKDIESIEILKDASATAIYGTRGANGVVIITTKSGNYNDSRIEVDYSSGIQEVINTISVLDTEGFTSYVNQAHQNAGREAPFQGNENLADTDWQDEILRIAPVQNLSARIAGGKDDLTYLFSYSLFDQEGVVENSGFTRNTFRMNLDKKIRQNISVGTNLTFSLSENNTVIAGSEPGSGVAGAISKALYMSPTLPVRDESLNYTNHAEAYNEAVDYIFNPVADALEIQNDLNSFRGFGSLFLEYSPIENLVLKANLGGDILFNRRNLFFPSITQRGDAAGGGLGLISNVESRQWLQEYTANYKHSFGRHSLDILSGFTYQTNEIRSVAAEASGFDIETFGSNNLSFGTNPQNADSEVNKREIVSFIGRVNYNYSGKYLLTLTGRVDGSSVFGANNKYAFFPAAAFAWNMTNEDFMQDQNIFDNFKWRVSYGITGNQEIPPYQSLGVVVQKVYDDGVFGLSPDEVSNEDLRWERTSQLDIGIDVTMFNERLTLAADYYYKNTTDLILIRDIPFISGDREVFENIGSLENRGFEFQLNYNIVLSSRLRWDIGGNISFNRNQISSLIDDVERIPIIPPNGFNSETITVLEVGQPLGAFYGFVFEGLDENGNRAYQDIVTDGQDGQTIINAQDRTIIGNPQPDFIYGLSSQLSFSNFDFSFLFQGVQGNDLLNFERVYSESANGLYNQRTTVLTDPDIPAPSLTNSLEPVSTRIIEDGSFLRLKNIALGYRFKMKNEASMRLYLSGQNLLTFTNYSGFDPEVNSFGQVNNALQGTDFGAYPNFRTYMAGLEIQF